MPSHDQCKQNEYICGELPVHSLQVSGIDIVIVVLLLLCTVMLPPDTVALAGQRLDCFVRVGGTCRSLFKKAFEGGGKRPVALLSVHLGRTE